MSTIELAIEELHKAFRLLNERIFHNELPLPAILVQNQGTRTRNILGWCTLEKIWADEQKTIEMYEINITAEFLNRPVVDIMETLLHEMVHLYCRVHNIKDTSRKGAYHNKRFKAQAELAGLNVTFDKSIGWAYTSLKPETKEMIESLDLNPEAFKIKRHTWKDEEDEGQDPGDKDEHPKSKNANIWHCPSCNMEIKARKNKELNIICGKCMQKFVKKSDED